MAVILGNADGTVYHRYGGRVDLSPMNIDSMLDIMKKGLKTHIEYRPKKNVNATKARPFKLKKVINNEILGKMTPVAGCYHCHYAREAQLQLSLKNRTWEPSDFWVMPPTERIGLTINQQQQYKVEKLISNSPAQKAGIKAEDILTSLSEKKILTKYDIQWILDKSSAKATAIPFEVSRKGQLVAGKIKLTDAWKVGTPEEYSWRTSNIFTKHMSKFLPTPGFTGVLLTKNELMLNRLPKNSFAMKISQLNYAIHLAGIRVGDIVLSASGKSDFKSTQDFYRFCEALRTKNLEIKMGLLRRERRINVMVGLSTLNSFEVRKPPAVSLGFIVQQLPGNDGTRVGTVEDGSSAEKVGLKTGDRIRTVDGQRIHTRFEFQKLMNYKLPGDLLALKILRGKETLSFAYPLIGEEEKVSEIARLSETVHSKGQTIECVFIVKIPEGKYVYSVHKKSLGIPTSIIFRGAGYELAGKLEEPKPILDELEGIEASWIHKAILVIKQKIVITDPKAFTLFAKLDAQLCDKSHCYQLNAVVYNNGEQVNFSEYLGHFNKKKTVKTKD
jgi:S1-C subfamily serine protease